MSLPIPSDFEKERKTMAANVSIIAPILHRPRNFQWCWNSATDSWINETEWTNYNDIENEIIEDAYQQNKFNVEIDDDFVINLEFLLQYKNDDEFTVRPIRRILLNSNRRIEQLRKDRFSVPIAIQSSLASEVIDGTKSNRIFRFLLSIGDLSRAYLFLIPPNSGKTLASVVADAAKGIIKAGTSVGKAREADWIAQQLLAVKDSCKNCSVTGHIPEILGQTCIALYTRESHFYKQLNYVMRNVKTIIMEQVMSYGPFCYLLRSFLEQIKSIPEVTVYRGVNLSDEQRQEFMTDKVTFTSFTSTSRDRKLAEWIGNTLLIIRFYANPHGCSEMLYCGSDIKSLSNIPDEEEFLIRPPAVFRFVKYEYDFETNKHIIYLEMK